MTWDFTEALKTANEITNPPPTEKQIEYAKILAECLRTELPNEFTKKAYSEFIDECQHVLEDMFGMGCYEND